MTHVQNHRSNLKQLEEAVPLPSSFTAQHTAEVKDLHPGQFKAIAFNNPVSGLERRLRHVFVLGTNY